METIEILRSARALIDAPEKWTKWTEARDAAGLGVPCYDKNAVCFCAVGAVVRHPTNGKTFFALRLLREALPTGGYIDEYNDHPETTHADILALFDRAIAAEEAAIKALDTPA